jgi:hypothetical protein
MTIASEITRLQWAKTSARTSIINKWVNVPANVTVDTYHSYIDQIQQWDGGILSSWIKLYPYRIYNSTYDWVIIWGVYSRFDGTKYYWLNAVSTYHDSRDENFFGICTYTKSANSDVSYWADFSRFILAYSTRINYTYFYKKWNEIRCYMVTDTDNYPRIYGTYAWRRCTWNFSTNTITIDNDWQSSSTNPSDWWEDLTWWTLVSWSSRVQSTTWQYDSPNGYIYLTLK